MERVRVGILGCGGISGGHARRLQALEAADLVALCDVDASITSAFRAKHMPQSDVAAYTDPAKMYAEAGLDGVIIATPHTLHFDHGMQALDAGCHVFMEKPMVTQADQAYQIAEKVEQTGKVFTIGYCTSCTPAFGYLRDRIRAQTFGSLELVNGYLCQNWLKATTGKWRQDPALSGGGQAYDSGAHILNSLVWSVETPVSEVFAFIDHHGTQVDINSAMAIRFQNNVMATLAIGGNCAKGGQHMAFIFEHGRVEIDGWAGTYIRVFADGEEETPVLPEEDGSPLANFVDAVLGRAEAKTGPQNGIHHTELMDAIYESAETGRPARPKARRTAA